MMNNKKGVSLVEVLMTVVIFGALSIGFYGLWNLGNRTFYADSNLVELQQQARNGLDRMVRDLRQAVTSSVSITTISASSDRVTFNTISSTGVKYYLSGTQLIREYPSGTLTPVAHNISYLKFTLTSRLLKIEIHADKNFFQTISVPLVEKVRLRNA
jgi:prepilin-type N-terminal cleavage/methylation domain-containing protein